MNGHGFASAPSFAIPNFMTVRRATIISLAILAIAAAASAGDGPQPDLHLRRGHLWVGARDSAATSQMLADWYSLSHIVHGLLFYAGLWLVARRWPAEWRFVAALADRSGWEVIENTPFVIDRYRETTAALGYTGDSVINSLSDIADDGPRLPARPQAPLWASVALLVALELIPLFVIRDNLTLNIWNLLAPNAAVAAWQAGG